MRAQQLILPDNPCFKGGAIDSSWGGSVYYSTTSFSCNTPVEAGLYLLTFNVIEPSQHGPNIRVFSVKVNEQIIFDSLDIFKIAGFQNQKRLSVLYYSTGELNFIFTTKSRSALIQSINIDKGIDLYSHTVSGVLTVQVQTDPTSNPVYFFNSNSYVYGPFQFVGPGPLPEVGPLSVGGTPLNVTPIRGPQ